MPFLVPLLENKSSFVAIILNQVLGIPLKLQNLQRIKKIIQSGKASIKFKQSKDLCQNSRSVYIEVINFVDGKIFRIPIGCGELIVNSQTLINQKCFDKPSKTPLFPMKVRKYSSHYQDEFQSEQTCESSSENFTDDEKNCLESIEKIKEPNLRCLISTFRYIISEGLCIQKNKRRKISESEKSQHEISKQEKQNKTFYLFNLSYQNDLLIQEQQKNNNQLLFFNVNYQNRQNASELICNKLQKIAQKSTQFLSNILLLHGIQFALILKMLNKKLSTQMHFTYILSINNLKFIQQHYRHQNISLLANEILLAHGITFSNIKIFQQFIKLFNNLQIPLKIKQKNNNSKILQYNQKQIYYKIDENFNNNQDLLQMIKCNQRQKIKIQTIVKCYKNSKNKKTFFFSFGKYQNFSFLINNRQILLKLSSQIVIYIFTPNSLNLFMDIIQSFPKIIFISYNYLEMAYNREVFSILSNSQSQIYLCEIIDQINEQLSQFPNLKLTIDRNVISIKQNGTNNICDKNLNELFTRIQDLIINYNKITNSHLVIDFINDSNLEIKHAYQSQLFFSNLILKNSQVSVDFVYLIIFGELVDMRFQNQLKNLFIQKKSSYYFQNTKFFSSLIKTNNTSDQNQNEIIEQQICKLFAEIFELHSESYFNKLKYANFKIMQKLRFAV